ncbi:hypothetical protein P67b_00016 [Ruegeria phage Tedan]|nr:hypothetical protein P67b_00016 [Ruegeria phage Tedan]
MNIFLTDPSPVKCAADLDDKRVVNQVRETGQLLCTALSMNGYPGSCLPMKPTHQGHPVTKWVAHSLENWLWTYSHFKALFHQKSLRYPDRPGHKTWFDCLDADIHSKAFVVMPGIGRTPFVNCAANSSLNLDFTHIGNVPEAYRLYLIERWETDARPPRWTNGNRPSWLARCSAVNL